MCTPRPHCHTQSAPTPYFSKQIFLLKRDFGYVFLPSLFPSFPFTCLPLHYQLWVCLPLFVNGGQHFCLSLSQTCFVLFFDENTVMYKETKGPRKCLNSPCNKYSMIKRRRKTLGELWSPQFGSPSRKFLTLITKQLFALPTAEICQMQEGWRGNWVSLFEKEERSLVCLLSSHPSVGWGLVYSFFFFLTVCKSSSWLPSQRDRWLVLAFNINHKAYIFFLPRRDSASTILGTERKQYSAAGGRLCKYILVWGEGMRKDKIFRKQSVREGCYPAQLGSRWHCLRGREIGPIKYALVGLVVGRAEVLTVGRADPSLRIWYPPLVSSIRAPNSWLSGPGGRKLQHGASCRGLNGFSGKSIGWRVGRPGFAYNLLCGLR